MAILKVSKPFVLRLPADESHRARRREFPVGEHRVSQEELSHWFVAGCIKDGRAVVLAESGQDKEQSDGGGQAAVYTEARLAKLKRTELEEIADELGLKHEGLPNKEAIVDLILEHQSGDAPDKDA